MQSPTSLSPRQLRQGLWLGTHGGTIFALPLRAPELLQPFLSMLFAVPLLGESLDALTVGFGLTVVAVVFIGRKMSVSTRN
jgi:drug/metabolite transporter (DMT)-like permease